VARGRVKPSRRGLFPCRTGKLSSLVRSWLSRGAESPGIPRSDRLDVPLRRGLSEAPRSDFPERLLDLERESHANDRRTCWPDRERTRDEGLLLSVSLKMPGDSERPPAPPADSEPPASSRDSKDPMIHGFYPALVGLGPAGLQARRYGDCHLRPGQATPLPPLRRSWTFASTLFSRLRRPQAPPPAAMYGSIRLNPATSDGTAQEGTFVAAHPQFGAAWPASAFGEKGQARPSEQARERARAGPPPPPELHVPGVVLPDYVDMLYDDTAGQPILAEARVVARLRERGHVVLNLMDAYRTKLGSPQNAINGPVLAKRDALIHNVAASRRTVRDVDDAAAAAEASVRAEADRAVGELNTLTAQTRGEVDRHLAGVTAQLERIQSFVLEATGPAASGDVLRFLRDYPSLCDEVQAIVEEEAPRAPSAEGPTEALRDFAARRTDVDDRMAAWRRLVEVKDSMVWQLLDDRKRLEADVEALQARFERELGAIDAQAEGYRRRLAEAGLLGADEG